MREQGQPVAYWMDGERRDSERTRQMTKQTRLLPDVLVFFLADCRECQSSLASQWNLFSKEQNITPVTVLDRGTEGRKKTGMGPGQVPFMAHYH